MNLHNPLPALWSSFLYASDALKVARRISAASIWTPNNVECLSSIEAYKRYLLNHTNFNRHADLQAIFKQAQQEHNDLFVLALWAVFERFLRDFLLEKGQVLEYHVMPNTLGQGLYQHYQKEVEYWNPEEILDFIKSLIPKNNNRSANLVGSAKQIYSYRNWVAHGKKEGKEPSHIKPKNAYSTLNEIADTLLQYS